MKRIEINGIEINPNGSPDSEILFSKAVPDGFVIGYLQQDSDCQNPLTDCDGMGEIRSLRSRHNNHISIEEAKDLLRDKMVVPLIYYEHGGCAWYVCGEEFWAPHMDWDNVSFAGVWVPDQCCREEIVARSRKRHIKYYEAARELAKQACESYTSWLNGDCYGIVTERFDEKGEFQDDDSCWGFVGFDYAKQSLEEQFNYEVTKAEKAGKECEYAI